MTSSSHINIRVLVATTGVTYKLSLLPAELTVSNIRGHLAAAVPQQDQILLLGPPYKVPKDATLQSHEILESLRMGDQEDTAVASSDPAILMGSSQSTARRLFLFSKQALSDQSPEITPCVLEPNYATTLPTEAPGPSLLTFQPNQPLHQALSAYERQFMLYLAQGRAVTDGTDIRVRLLRQCIQEQAVLCRALRAAVSNLSDHFGAAARTRAEFSVSFAERTANHAKLLRQFDSVLMDDLPNIRLHPALSAIARASGRTMNTLLDTVPVERERAWSQQCQKSHQRLQALYRELEVTFTNLGSAADREVESKGDQEAEAAVEKLWAEIGGQTKSSSHCQSKRLETLTEGHGDAIKIITNALNGNDSDIQQAFLPLQERSNSFQVIVNDMKKEEEIIVSLIQRVADSKTDAMKRMKVRLREVSLAQSSIQRVLASVGVLRDALSQQTDNMVHLEHIAELSNSYTHFLTEIERRRAYGKAVTASSVVMMERLAVMREDELKEREKFLRGPGQHLMPVFFETFVPTLATPPPLFTPQMPGIEELDALPQIGVEASTNIGGDEAASVTMSGIQHSATLGATQSSVSTMAKSERHIDTVMDDSSHERHQPQPQENLIVSADETSGTILDPSAAAVADAELKTLAYENATLRQALERVGGKSPRKYLGESRQREVADDSKELQTLRNKLAEAKVKVQDAANELADLKASLVMSQNRNKDKISHCSFEVGDVGLFMPTGRSLGKPKYLAFHSGCPNRFLSPDCVEGTPDFVLGRIVYQEKMIAGEVGTAENPFGINAGTAFYMLTVEVLKPSKK